MGRISGMAVFLTALVLGSAAFAGEPLEEELDQFLRGFVGSYENLDTVTCTVTRHLERWDGPSTRDVFQYAFKRERERLDRVESTEEKPPWQVKAWDGTECRSFGSSMGASQHELVGAIRPHNRHMFADSPVSSCYHPLALTVHRMVDDDRYDIREVGTDTVRGRPCRILQFKGKSLPPGSKARHLYWISADGRYQLLRSEGYLNSGVRRTRDDYIWSRTAGRVLPEKVVTRLL